MHNKYHLESLAKLTVKIPSLSRQQTLALRRGCGAVTSRVSCDEYINIMLLLLLILVMLQIKRYCPRSHIIVQTDKRNGNNVS